MSWTIFHQQYFTRPPSKTVRQTALAAKSCVCLELHTILNNLCSSQAINAPNMLSKRTHQSLNDTLKLSASVDSHFISVHQHKTPLEGTAPIFWSKKCYFTFQFAFHCRFLSDLHNNTIHPAIILICEMPFYSF